MSRSLLTGVRPRWSMSPVHSTACPALRSTKVAPGMRDSPPSPSDIALGVPPSREPCPSSFAPSGSRQSFSNSVRKRRWLLGTISRPVPMLSIKDSAQRK